jgi:hypothetical protein
LFGSNIFYVGEDCIVTREFNPIANTHFFSIFPFAGNICIELQETEEYLYHFLEYLKKNTPK